VKNVPIIAISNQKGGVAKTTTSAALADGLRRRGYKVLAVDTDPQGSLGSIDPSNVAPGTACASGFIKGCKIVATEDGQATVPGDPGLATIADERDLGDEPITEHSLRDAIRFALNAHGFDCVIIDTQPGMTFLTTSAIIAATHIIIPTTADAFGIEAVRQSAEYLDAVSSSYETSLADSPLILITLYRGMAKLARTFADQMEQVLPQEGFKMINRRIPISIAVQEAQAQGKSIYDVSVLRGAALEYDIACGLVEAWLGLTRGE